jgi:molybdate transport system regulatory protein
MPGPGLKVASRLSLETRGGVLGSQRWMDLLRQLGAARSIAAAARASGLSYKAAWDAIEAMNNLAGAPLVVSSIGGRGGGGARLTARGEQLVATYVAIAAEHARFVDGLNARLRHAERDLRLIGSFAMRTSARNQFSGVVARLHQGAVNDEVELALPGGERIVAVITRESTETLGLKRGRAAFALVKASSVLVAVEDDERPLRLSARNRLAGTVRRLTRGAVNCEVVIQSAGGVSVAAIITKASATALGLKRGAAASAIFKASSVILGVSD